MQSLREGNLLQEGKYRIERTFGQGSFGITYHATMKLTMTGKLGQMDTIKEFFVRDITVKKRYNYEK